MLSRTLGFIIMFGATVAAALSMVDGDAHDRGVFLVCATLAGGFLVIGDKGERG